MSGMDEDGASESKDINVLLVEDNPDDIFLLRKQLERARGASFNLIVVETLQAGIDRMTANGIDVVLLDLALPDSLGLETFHKAQDAAPNIPIIVLSGMDDETVALNAVHAGAQDYLVKGRGDSQLLTRAMIYAIERTQARAALQQAEEKFRSIFENAVEGIFQTTPQGRFISANPALVRTYGYDSPEELISKMTDIGGMLYVDPERREAFIRLMQEEGEVRDFESKIHRKDGNVIWISENARAVKDAQGRVLYYEGMVEDITARKHAEETLRFSEGRFRSVWESASDGMRLTDEKGAILAINPSFCNIVGMPAEELKGRHFTVVYADSVDLRDMSRKYRERFAERKIETQIERHVRFRSGQEAYLELSNSFIEMGDAKEPLLLSVFHDVTSRKFAEERERRASLELARSREELRRKNEIMEDDLRMAHEIQTAILPQQYPVFPASVAPAQSLLQFCHRYHPTGEVGGDFFNVFPLSDTKAGLFICDVMGHGVRSALVTAMVRALVEELRPVAANPGELLARLNGDLRAILRQTGTPLFTTAFYLVADLERRQFLYANAGHPKPFLIHRARGDIEMLKSFDDKSRPALGLFEDARYPTSQSPLNPGDVILLYTDGLYEVESLDQVQYSKELLREAVQRHLHAACPQMLDVLLNEIQEFSGNQVFADDVCLVAMEVSPELASKEPAGEP